jgi:broad specificity phosphatase PhoE
VAKLLLVKHAQPVVDPLVPASGWHLSEAGRESFTRLGVALRAFEPAALFASPQPKAKETAARSPSDSDSKLRSATASASTTTPTRRSSAARRSSRRPSETSSRAPTSGCSAARARARLSLAFRPRWIRRSARTTGKTVALFSHGRVISLYLASRGDVDEFAIWQRLTLPSLVVLDLPDRRSFRVVAPI